MQLFTMGNGERGDSLTTTEEKKNKWERDGERVRERRISFLLCESENEVYARREDGVVCEVILLKKKKKNVGGGVVVNSNDYGYLEQSAEQLFASLKRRLCILLPLFFNFLLYFF